MVEQENRDRRGAYGNGENVESGGVEGQLSTVSIDLSSPDLAVAAPDPEQLRLDVVSLGPSRIPNYPAADPALFPDLPKPALTGDEGVILQRGCGYTERCELFDVSPLALSGDDSLGRR